MATTRKTLGLILNISENWIGGTYYILNLIKALNLLNDNQKPHIIIISPEANAGEHVKKETSYPYLSFIRAVYPVSTPKGFINAISTRLLKKKIFIKNITANIDVMYPATQSLPATNVKKKVYWVPDFQEHHFPAFFSEEEIQSRKTTQKWIAEKAGYLILSSRDAKKDFETIYPQHNCKVQVLPFAVSNPDIHQINAREILAKYDIHPGFFFIANQFWVHKNHIVILEAIKKLKDEGLFYTFVFSGKTNDYRSSGHYKMLMQKAADSGIMDNIRFLGFIDRADQLVLMKEAESVIQPSLFEGWGTVVEDAKSLGQFIIASDIEVHKEQLADYPHLMFQKNNGSDLAEKIKEKVQSGKMVFSYAYEDEKEKFAQAAIKTLISD